MLPIIRKILLFLGSCSISTLAAAADITSKTSHVAGADSPVSISYILQILSSFIAVILFILVIAWLMKKSGRFGVSNNKVINIVSSMSLGMREKIVVVNVEGVNIVIGVAPGQIRTLYVMGESPSKEEIVSDQAGGGFGRIMGNFLK
jgi:flagellar protein FliO/FliZ